MLNIIRFIYLLIPVTCTVQLRRIIGGEYAVISEYPHLGFISGTCGEEQWICGTSILNQRILLTAAHCFQGCRLGRNKGRHKIAVFFGNTYMSNMMLQRRIKEIVPHPTWDEINGSNDIALAIVRKDIPFGENVKRVVISRIFPNVTKHFEAYVAGWGEEIAPEEPLQGSLTGHLRKTYQKLRSPTSCNRYGKMYKGMFCAGRMQKVGEYPSGGDSGSPLVTRNQYQQIGLVSFGWFLYPAMTVYTNITYFHGWIMENAANLYCENTK